MINIVSFGSLESVVGTHSSANQRRYEARQRRFEAIRLGHAAPTPEELAAIQYQVRRDAQARKELPAANCKLPENAWVKVW